MKVIRSYGIEIRDAGRRTFQPTVDFYRSAVMYLIGVVNSEWGTIAEIEGANARMFSAEYLTHATKNNIPKYAFDAAFPKMPSYLRRAAIRDAVGAVSSYKSSLANWKAAGCHGKAPKLTLERNVMPSFFGGNMCRAGEEPNTVRLKLYDGHDWIWKTIKLKKTDVQYIEHHCGGMKESSPTLERRYGRYYLRCAYEENVPLSNAQLQDRLICAVDLGINTDAVCSVMKSDGTVVARRFIDFPADKDLIYTLTRRTRRAYREHGPESAGSKWSYARRLNEQLADRIAKEITAFAAEWSCDCIVFEYLDFRGRKHHGSKAQKLTMWRRNDIQHRTENKAHGLGIRISHVCAWNTSRLAFDGSGKLTRSADNRQLATFSTGKQYNADLNASYNIGARYFIRELLKSLSAKRRSGILAKVPECRRRTSCTLSSLKKLSSALTA